jgi:hypothetical protein
MVHNPICSKSAKKAVVSVFLSSFIFIVGIASVDKTMYSKQTENIVIDNFLSISYQVTPIGCTGNNGAINITVTSGTPPYQFYWSNGATTEDLAGITMPETYTVTVSDASGLNSVTSIYVDYDPATLSLSYQVILSGCTGTIDLSTQNGASPFTFTWSNGNTTQDLINQPAGIYWVTVTDVLGCIRIKQAGIILPQLNTEIIPINVTNCTIPANGAADLTVTGGTIPYSYLWSNSYTSEDLQDVIQGTYFLTVTDFCGTTTTDTAIIGNPVPFTFSFITENPSCNNNYFGSISATVNNATAPLYYNWSNQASSENITDLTNGQYWLTVTDVYGCQGTSNAILSGLSQPVLSIEVSDSVICSGDVVHINATTNIISSYTVSQSTQTESTSGSGVDIQGENLVSGPYNIGFSFNYWGNTYDKFYIGSNGWIGFNAGPGGTMSDPWATVIVPDSTPTSPKNCIMACWRDWSPVTGQIKYASVGFAPDRKLIISYINVALNNCPTFHGTFQIILYEGSNNIRLNLINVNTCVQWNNGNGVMGLQNFYGTQAVTIPALNNTSWTALNTGFLFSPVFGPVVFQNGDSVINNQSIDVYPDSTTFFTAQCNSLCGATNAFVTVNVDSPPGLTAGNDTSICQGDSVVLFAGPGYDTYHWSTGANTQVIAVSPSYSQVYMVTGQINACIDSSTVQISVIPVPSLDLGPDQQICTGDILIVEIDPGLGFDSYLWSTGETAAGISLMPSANLTLSVVASNICVADTAEITVTVNNYLYFDLGNDTSVCDGTPVTLNTGPGFISYYWSTGATNQTITVTPQEETEYTVFTVGQCNYVWDTITITTVFHPVADFWFDAESSTFINTSLYFTYCTWKFGDGSPVSHDTNPVHVYSQPGAYYVYLYVENKCWHDFIIYRIEYFGIIENPDSKFIVFPNPVKDVLYGQLPGNISSIVIDDMTGKHIFSRNISGYLFSIDLSGLAPGVYLIKAVSDDILYVREIIRE